MGYPPPNGLSCFPVSPLPFIFASVLVSFVDVSCFYLFTFSVFCLFCFFFFTLCFCFSYFWILGSRNLPFFPRHVYFRVMGPQILLGPLLLFLWEGAVAPGLRVFCDFRATSSKCLAAALGKKENNLLCFLQTGKHEQDQKTKKPKTKNKSKKQHGKNSEAAVLYLTKPQLCMAKCRV